MSEGTRRRAPRGSISRERIVDAAIVIADTDGIAGLSMPKVARRLDIGVMSLYGHVTSKDDLVDAVAQRLLEQLPETDVTLHWRESIRSHFRALRSALVRHPGLGEVLQSRPLAVPAAIEILERNLHVLRAGGLAPDAVTRTYYALLTYTLGFVSWELPRRGGSPHAYVERWNDVLASLPVDGYPAMHSLRDHLVGVASDDQYEYGLDALLSAAGRARD